LPLEELEAGVEALEALRRSHKNLGEITLRLLLDVASIISPFGGVATAVKAVYDFFQAVTRLRYGEVAGLLKFVEAAEKARAYVRRLEFEALVDSVALEWGMETGRFKILVEALGDPSLVDWLAHGQHVDSLGKFGKVYARYNAEELGVTEEYVIEAGVRHPLAKRVFVEKAGEVMRLLGSNRAVVLKGPRGVGKSTLAKYVAYTMLMQEQVDYVVVPEGPINVNELLTTAASLRRRVMLLFDVHPREVYTPRFILGAAEGAEKPLEVTARAINSLLAVAKAVNSPLAAAEPDTVDRLRVLLTASEEELKVLGVELDPAAEYRVDLGDVEFLAEVVRSYMGERAESCQEVEKLARIIKEHHPDGAYTLVAKYAGLWLRERGCDVSDVERAVEEAKQEPKLFLARYIRDVLLWRSSGEERVRLLYRVAAPLLLHAVFGPVPEGVTYITQARDGVVFYQPEEIEKLTQPQWDLLKAGLQPIAKWLAQRHEDLVEETLRDLAGLNGEEAREPYEKALSDLIEALDWARDEASKEVEKIFAELGIPKERRGLETALLAFVARRLAAVFKSGEVKRCWRRAALIAGYALAGYPKLHTTKPPEDSAEVLGDALKPCAVHDYLTIDGEIPWLSANVVWFPYFVEAQYARDLLQIRRIRERLSVLTPFVITNVIKAARKTAEKLSEKRRNGNPDLLDFFYALGLVALATEGEVDGETADLLLYAMSSVVQWVAHPAAVLPILAALRPLGEKASHRYVAVLAAASVLTTLNRRTARYIYNVLHQLESHRLEMEPIWSLVNFVVVYSNLLTKHLIHIEDRREDAVANMCMLYDEIKKREAAASERGSTAQRLINTTAETYVLAVALHRDDLAQLVQIFCGLGERDIVKEAETVRSMLEEAVKIATHPEGLRKIIQNNADFVEWVATYRPTDDAGIVLKDLNAWLTAELARYKLGHALNKRGELDEKKLEKVAEEFEKAAEIRKELNQWGNYLVSCVWALRARILAAKSWEEFLKTAEGFRGLWREAEEHLEPTAGYLATAASILGQYLIYLAASGERKGAEELLKERRLLLDYSPETSVATRLMLRLLGVGEGAKLEEVLHAFEHQLSTEYRPALWMLASRLQKDQALERCAKFIPPWLEALYIAAHSIKSKTEVCVDAVAAAAGIQIAAEMLRLVINIVLPEAHLLLSKVDGKTLVEALALEYSPAQLAFMLLAAVEGRDDAVRLYALLGSMTYRDPLLQRFFRAVYENCGDLNSKECGLALLKLYYLHF
jgi:hypothetical protein